MLLTFFLGIVAYHLVVVREVRRQLALETRGLLRAQLAAAVPVGKWCSIAVARVQPLLLVLDAIHHPVLLPWRRWPRVGRGRYGSSGGGSGIGALRS